MPPPTLAVVATAAGVAKSTASVALRGLPGVSEEERARVVAVAERLGYRHNPLVAALMTYRRTAQPTHFRVATAFVTDAEEGDHFNLHAMARHARARARELGLPMQLFRWQDYAERPTSLARVLRARGVAGVVLALRHPSPQLQVIDWKGCALVAMSAHEGGLTCDRVTADEFENMLLALDQTVSRFGHRRVGCVVAQDSFERDEHRNAAAYLLFRERHPPRALARIPVLSFASPAEVLPWFERHRPTAIVTPYPTKVAEQLGSAGLAIPDDVSIVSTYLQEPDTPHFAGIDPDIVNQGHAAAESLAAAVTNNRRGLPASPVLSMLSGRWSEGRSLRAWDGQTTR